MVDASLTAFFSQMAPFLRGGAAAADVESALGASPSGREALGFYRDLVVGDLLGLLESLFPITARASARSGVEFQDLARGYLTAYPRLPWDPSRAGDLFPDWLIAERERGRSLPIYLEELADLEATWLSAALSDAPDGVLEQSVFVREYTHALVVFVRDWQSPTATLPPPEPSLLLLHRSTYDGLARAYPPSLEAFLALAERNARDLSQFPQVGREDLARGERELVDAGVLPAIASVPRATDVGGSLS